MTASGTIDRGPEARTIYHRIFYNIQYGNHAYFFVILVNLDVLDVLDNLERLKQFLLHATLDVCHAVVQLAELAVVPAVGSTH